MAQKEKKTAQIIEAAIQEFLSKGLDASSMHNIAVQADVSKRTLYKYYSTKELLYNALIDELLNRVLELNLVYSPEKTITEQLREILQQKLTLYFSDSFLNISRIALGEILKKKQLTPLQLERLYSSEAIFIDWIDAAKKDNQITSSLESELIANQFHSILKGQSFYPVLYGFVDVKNIDQEAIVAVTIEFFINSFCSK
ncbi:TetR/AcrR family transcriptional regulator [Litorilituus lipolyticus]|uniref:TetR/AcrR family transcriptional regulator n=1 Tax=Litorilituus lipolyticus TaxID=2491017 RepID=A0A502L2H8_9GAMM|nr:TetR/AcrR family transcriptional regulator [Litorilituus lipolyticus]TPH18138.1 TetR/AcrR family transcriptional regulator [Litorilituus lipolyticus]